MFGNNKRTSDLEGLVKHLKNEKRKIKRDAFKLVRDLVEPKFDGPLQQFVNRNYPESAYLFVNSKGFVLGYTPAFELALKIPGDMRGKHYLELFNFSSDENSVKDSIKEYFSSPKEISIPYSFFDGKKKREYILTKEEPIYTDKIDIKLLNSERKVRMISFVPIKLNPQKRNFWGRKKSPEGEEIQRGSKLNDVELKLLLHHGWMPSEIESYKKDYGSVGILMKYNELEKKTK